LSFFLKRSANFGHEGGDLGRPEHRRHSQLGDGRGQESWQLPRGRGWKHFFGLFYANCQHAHW